MLRIFSKTDVLLNKLFLITLISLTVLCYSCEEKQVVEINLSTDNTSQSNVVIKKYMTEDVILTSQIKDTTIQLNLSVPTIALIEIEGSSNSSYLILVPGEKTRVKFSEDKLLTTNLRDSLSQYIYDQHNKLLGQHSSEIFSKGNNEKVAQWEDSLINSNRNVIESFDEHLSSASKEILTFQNMLNSYNFLFYYGRVVHKLEAKEEFFDFVKNLKPEGNYSKSYPLPFLYKYEVEYLRKHQKITSVSEFVSYLEERIADQDKKEFFKAYFLKVLIEMPQYWQKHNQIITSTELKALLQQEKHNEYAYLFTSASKSYFSARKGEEAKNFAAVYPDSLGFNLEDFKHKYIVIDAWATWCGPCIKQKPDFNEVVEHFKGNEDILFLSVSIDKSYQKWAKYIEKHPESSSVELNVRGGKSSEFAKAYNVQSIPRYIFISPEGKIINADMVDPKLAMINAIEKEIL